MKKEGKLSPTLLCADQMNLQDTMEKLNSFDLAWYHVDIMDGHFVPNLAFGLLALEQICRVASHPVCGHFMVEKPAAYLEASAKAGLDYFAFHLETERNPFRLVEQIRRHGMKPAAAINPMTPIDDVRPLLPYLDLVILMAVEPGYSGQRFLPCTWPKLEELAGEKKNHSFLIEIDGGVNMENLGACIQGGADVLVAGAFTLFRPNCSLEENFRQTDLALRKVLRE